MKNQRRMTKKNKKNFNESFMDVYNNTSLTAYDLEPKFHAEVTPAYADAMMKAKKVRERMKDDFKEQDKIVKEFLDAQELEENPKIVSTKPLKDMKLAENRMSGNGKKRINEHFQLYDNHEEAEDRDELLRKIDDSINDLFYWYQQKHGVETGDFAYDDAFLLDDIQENIADIIIRQSEFARGFEECLTENKRVNPINESSSKNVKKNRTLTEDYSNFIGKPLKDFLSYIYRHGSNNPAINIEYEDDNMGMSGFSGRASEVPWYSSDRVIKDIFLGDSKYYDFKVITESVKLNEERGRKTGSTGGIEGFQYKVVAADENNRHKKSVSAKGIDKLTAALEVKFNEATLNAEGKTQLYVYKVGENPNNPIYFKVANDDGTWDVLVDEIDKDVSAEERKTLYNCVQADLMAGNERELERLRQVPRDSGKTGFDAESVGFKDDVFYLSSVNDSEIEWAKKVAAYYGLRTSEVQENNGKKFIRIYAPGAEAEMLSHN